MGPHRTRRTKAGHDRATYTASELTRVLGLARSGVYAGLKDGTIPNFRVGRRFVIPKAAVESWFASIGRQKKNNEDERR